MFDQFLAIDARQVQPGDDQIERLSGQSVHRFRTSEKSVALVKPRLVSVLRMRTRAVRLESATSTVSEARLFTADVGLRLAEAAALTESCRLG